MCGKQKVDHSFLEKNPNSEFSCPVAVFENTSDPRQKPMYPKHLVSIHEKIITIKRESELFLGKTQLIILVVESSETVVTPYPVPWLVLLLQFRYLQWLKNKIEN